MRIKWFRIATAAIVLAVMLWGVIAQVDVGTTSAFSIAGIPFTCPLGYLEAALASRNLLPHLWLGVGLVLLSVVLFGRFFCAWVCPTSLLRQLFGTRQAAPSLRWQNGNHAGGPATAPAVPSAETFAASYSGFAMLVGALGSSFLFGFPVFCAICPIGLIYGTFFAISRLVFANQPSIELFVFPLILGIELFAARSWCSSICPLGALLGILARFNHTLRLRVERDRCLASQGIQCRACEKACLYGFNISKEQSNPIVNACAKCFECYESCPTKAIRLGLTK
jgi:ferredoxin-type protein NapH